jgi:hypothetical protein
MDVSLNQDGTDATGIGAGGFMGFLLVIKRDREA